MISRPLRLTARLRIAGAALAFTLLLPLSARAEQTFASDLAQIWQSYQGGRYEQADSQIRAFIGTWADDPQFADTSKRLNYLLAITDIRLSKWEDALAAAAEFEKAPGASTAAWQEEIAFWQGVALFRLQRYEEARRALTQFATKFSTSTKAFPALLMAGGSYVAESNFKDAAQYFATLRPRARGLDYGRVLVPELYSLIQSEQYDRALTLAAEGDARLDQIPQIAGFELLILDLANRLAAAGNDRASIGALLRIRDGDEILQLQRKRIDAIQTRLAQLEQAEPRGALTHELKQLLEKIRSEITTFEQIQNFDTAVRFQLASSFLKLQRYRETAFVLDRMLEQMPPNPIIETATDTLIKCYAEIGQWPKVVATADRFAEKFPNSEHLPGTLVLKGQALQADARYGEAAQAFDEMIARFPDDPLAAEALFLKGYTYILEQQFADSRKIFTEVLDKYPKSPVAEKALFWVAQSWSLDRRHEDTIPAMEKYLQQYPDGEFSIEAAYRIAFAHQALSEFSKSIPQLEDFLKKHPQDINAAEAMLLLGEAQMAQAKIPEGIAILQKVPANVGSYREEAFFKIAKAYEALEQYDEMRATLGQFIKEYPQSARLAEAVSRQGGSYRDDRESARKLYWDAIRKYGNDPAQWGVTQILASLQKLSLDDKLGQEYLQQLEDLADTARKARQRTLHERAQWALAQLHSKTGNPQATAQALLQAAPDVNPQADDPAIIADIADALHAAGKKDEAATLYAEIRRWNPLSPLRARAFLGLGTLARERGDAPQALEWFDRFLRETPDSPLRGDVELQRAGLLVEKGRDAEAIASLESLLKDSSIPKNQRVEAIYKIGEIHMQQGRPKLAFPYFQRIYVMYGAYRDLTAKAYLQSALALEKLGDDTAAARTYLEMLASPPLQESPNLTADLAEARIRLDKLPAAARSEAEKKPDNLPGVAKEVSR